MKRITFFAALLFCTAALFAQEPVQPVTHSTDQNSTIKAASAVTESTEATTAAGKSDYAEQYKGIAIAEMQRVGIPASIKLAQGILESGSGTSELAKNANNHFGIKCGGGWTGKSYKKKDDDKDENGETVESCFRRYDKAEESFYDHSEFLRDPRKYYRYGFLFGLDKRDYRAWAKGLESAGYATQKGYADRVIDIIERYSLYKFDDPEIQVQNSGDLSSSKPKTDKEKAADKETGPPPLNSRVGRINDTKVVLAQGGETLDDIARTFRLSPQKVADYNERKYTPGKPLDINTRIFIQEKKCRWRGRAKFHYVRADQTMFDISQQYGVKLRELLKRNAMLPGQEPETGEKIRVRGRRKSSENVRLREVSKPNSNTTRPTPPATVGEELFEIGSDNSGTTSGGTKPSTSGNSPFKPSTTPGSGKLPTDPIPQTGNPQTTPSNVPVVTPPVSAPKPPVVAPPGYHTVIKGDTLFSLARKYNITVAKLKSLNGLTSDQINLGQVLRVQ